MHRALRERDFDALFVKGLFDLAREVEPDCPVVRRLHPGADDEIDTRVRQLGNRDLRSRVGKDPLFDGEVAKRYAKVAADLIEWERQNEKAAE